MRINRRKIVCTLALSMFITLSGAISLSRADTGICGGVNTTLPFTDVTGKAFFCQIAAAYFSGLINGTTPTTYSPDDIVTREQMAAFTTRTLDQSLKRGSRRAALKQWATPKSIPLTATTTVGLGALHVAADGTDIWVANLNSDSVSRVRASDGKLLENWTGVDALDVLVARGRVYVLGNGNPGHLYQFDPRQPAGAVTLLATVGPYPMRMATDGEFIWVVNGGLGAIDGSVSRVHPDTGAVQTFTDGLADPSSLLYDGAHIWVTSYNNGLHRLKRDGSIGLTVPGPGFAHPVFDGTNIWVPGLSADSVTVVRAATGAIVATLSGNGLRFPTNTAFDGQRILVTNQSGESVSLWRATDLTPLGSFSTGDNVPKGACSDGINFWITFGNKLARF